MHLLGCKLSAYSGISSYLKIHRHFGHIDEKIVWKKYQVKETRVKYEKLICRICLLATFLFLPS